MTEVHRAAAHDPSGLALLFNARANNGDVEGLVALYEPHAILAVGSVVASGHTEIRKFFVDLLARRSEFPMPRILPAMVSGDIALTAARSADGNISVEIARLQPDGTWLWMMDQLRIPRSE